MPLLLSCTDSNNDRVAQQANRALRNLNQDNEEMDLKTAASAVIPDTRSNSFRKQTTYVYVGTYVERN